MPRRKSEPVRAQAEDVTVTYCRDDPNVVFWHYNEARDRWMPFGVCGGTVPRRGLVRANDDVRCILLFNVNEY